MLLPKFTIRQMMIATVVAAFVCAILGFAAQGSVIAYGLAVAILGLVVPLAAYAFVYWTLLAVTGALPGKELPIGPTKPVSRRQSSGYDSAVTRPAAHPQATPLIDSDGDESPSGSYPS